MHVGLIGGDIDVHLPSRHGWIVRRVLRDAQAVTVPGRSAVDLLAAEGVPTEKLHILPHSIDTGAFAPNERVSKRYSAIFTGRLAPEKRIDVALRAFATVVDKLPSATLAVVGDGPLAASLQRLSAELGIDQSVGFLGHRDDIVGLLQSSKVFVLSSEREGLSFSLIEAMCCGVVPVSTNVGAASEVVTHGENGFLVRVGDPEEVADRILELLKDDREYARMSGNATRVREDYGFGAATRVFDGIFEQMAAG
jgi:glycosyltransferase involved in cell wall biosynthesis